MRDDEAPDLAAQRDNEERAAETGDPVRGGNEPRVRADRFVDDGVGLIFGGSSHGGLPDTADWGPMCYYRLVVGYGSERRLATLIRWDTGAMRFARWRPATHRGGEGTRIEDPRLIDYVLGDDQGRSKEIDPQAAHRFMDEEDPHGQ